MYNAAHGNTLAHTHIHTQGTHAALKTKRKKRHKMPINVTFFSFLKIDIPKIETERKRAN